MNSTYLFLFLFFSNSKVVSAPKKIHFEVQRLRNHLHRLRLLIFRRRSLIWKITHKAGWRKILRKASCWDYDDFYIGKMKRRLQDRKSEHFTENPSKTRTHISCCWSHESHGTWYKMSRSFWNSRLRKNRFTTARKKTNHVYKHLTQP